MKDPPQPGLSPLLNSVLAGKGAQGGTFPVPPRVICTYAGVISLDLSSLPAQRLGMEEGSAPSPTLPSAHSPKDVLVLLQGISYLSKPPFPGFLHHPQEPSRPHPVSHSPEELQKTAYRLAAKLGHWRIVLWSLPSQREGMLNQALPATKAAPYTARETAPQPSPLGR